SRTSACSTAGGTRATRATTAGRSAAASRTPTRRRKTGRTPRTSIGCSSRSCSRPTTTETRPASRIAGSRSCARRWRRRSGSSRPPGCFRSTRNASTSRPPVSPSPRRPPSRSSPRPAESVAPRISLALALHNHQPVGNFGWVFSEVFEKAYAPMVDALERHPGVRVSLHYTGPLLDWLMAERGDTIDRLRALVDRDQVEIMGGGYYEPVLVSLPERDRVGQLTRMADDLERLFGRRPRGAWLAERVWEPDMPPSLVAAGYEWTILDDAHFRAAA